MLELKLTWKARRGILLVRNIPQLAHPSEPMRSPTYDLNRSILQGFAVGPWRLVPLGFVDSGPNEHESSGGTGFLGLERGDEIIAKFWAGASADDEVGAELVGSIATQAAKCNIYPLVIVPYLSSDDLQFGLDAQVSMVDLCGNFVICPRFTTRDCTVFLWVEGKPNRYRVRRNPYSGVAAMVGRAFTIATRFNSVKSITNLILARHGKISQPVVSRTVAALVDEGVLARSGSVVRLKDAERLLDRLSEEYKPPGYDLVANVNSSLETVVNVLAVQGAYDLVVLLGADSAPWYVGTPYSLNATLAVSDPHKFFEGKLGDQLSMPKGSNSLTGSVGTLKFVVTQKTRNVPPIWFDSRQFDMPWDGSAGNPTNWREPLPQTPNPATNIVASPIECYLNLISSNFARSTDNAVLVRREILRRIEQEREIDRRIDKSFGTSTRKDRGRTMEELVRLTTLPEAIIRARLDYRWSEYEPLNDWVYRPTEGIHQ